MTDTITPIIPSPSNMPVPPIVGIPKPSANLLDHLPSYDYEGNEQFIDDLKIELEQQHSVNKVLLSKIDTVKEYKEQINEFIDTNADRVSEQLHDITTLTEELKFIINKNLELRTENTEWNELLHEEKYVKLAEEIKEIKKAKKEIKTFLDKQGILSPQ